MSDWQGFFVAAGIPPGIASRYAKSFETNRITRTMLPDLDKSTLSELGIKAIGDQLAILRRIKDSGNAHKVDAVKKPRQTITAPPIGSSSNPVSIPTASEARKGRPPPDSHEIYHIRMPLGSTEKTRKILQAAKELRGAGILKRALSGVRQGGRPVSPVSRDPEARRLAMHNRVMQHEVSSSTDSLSTRLGVRGMYSDRVEVQRVQTGKIVKKTVTMSPSLFSRAVGSFAAETTIQPKIRVRLPSAASPKRSLPVSDSAPGLLPRVTVNLSGLTSSASVRKRNAAGGVGTRVTLPGSYRETKPRGKKLHDRISRAVGGRGQKMAHPVKVIYEEEDEEIMDDQEMGEEEYVYDDVEDADNEDVEYEDEEMVYGERPSIYDRIRL